MDLKVMVMAGAEARELTLSQKNYDVLQMIEIPINEEIRIEAQGKSEVVVQSVVRFNLPQPEEMEQVIQIHVNYSTDQMEVNDLVRISVGLIFVPPVPMTAKMTVDAWRHL